MALSRLEEIDDRLYRNVRLYKRNPNDGLEAFNVRVSPLSDYGSYASDFYATPGAIELAKEELETDYSGADKKTAQEQLDKQKKTTEEFLKTRGDEFFSPHSMIHPYALINLAGACGISPIVSQDYAYDDFRKRKFYEVDGDNYGGYAKSPTTTTLIRWGNADPQYRTPYSYQDFVFCKWWKRIENNRMITLRRYAAPVLDNLRFSEYNLVESSTKKENEGTVANHPWSPLATAVTYFGDGTGNTISELLKFTVKYEWEHMDDTKQHPFDITSSKADEGNGLISDRYGVTTSGLSFIAQAMGIMSDTAMEVNGSGQSVIDPAYAANDLPPDPYKDGPYENRIIGPINVITDTWKRKRGLKFTNEGLKLTFSYVARPISGINNKAILLDLLSNMLTMVYSRGSWFGGMWRYASNPSLYPFKYGDAMNKLYKGKLFGKEGAIRTLADNVYKDGTQLAATIFPDVLGTLKNFLKGAFDSVVGALTGNETQQQEGADEWNAAISSGTMNTFNKVMAAKALKGATIPYIQTQRALLTGDPIGDWHLTIGNPLNPIAMIGNLIVTSAEFKFSDELGPDDFPIGFDCTVTLNHGLGRDREAVESMFNRGAGRLYTLPYGFRSSADSETKVDENSGMDGTRIVYEETRNTYFGGGYRHLVKTQSSEMKNSGNPLNSNDIGARQTAFTPLDATSDRVRSDFVVQPWQTAYIL